MAKPEGVSKGKKNNSHKHPYEREKWMKAKKVGRPKQIWVDGHWEKQN
jgi:hypothetical protein